VIVTGNPVGLLCQQNPNPSPNAPRSGCPLQDSCHTYPRKCP
jgi:hypothetical protein